MGTRGEGPESRSARLGSLLDADAELLAVVPNEERELARRATRTAAIRLRPGPTTVLDELSDDAGVWGFYVVTGVVVRATALAHVLVPELVGPGEVLGPRA